MTPEERTFAATRLRELAAQNQEYTDGGLEMSEVIFALGQIGLSIAQLAEVLALLIEDQDDPNGDDPNDRPRCNWHTNGQGWASCYAGTYTDRCVLYEGHAAAGHDVDHRMSTPPPEPKASER